MTFSKKIKTLDNKIEKNKTQYYLGRDKLLLFQLYHKEMLVNMIILTEEDVLPEKRPLGKLLKSKDVNIHHYVVS